MSRHGISMLAALSLTFGAMTAMAAARQGVGVSISTPFGGPGPQTITRQVPIGTGVLSGAVLAADTGQPVRHAQITLTGEADPPSGAIAPGAGSRPDAIYGSRVTGAGPPGSIALQRTAMTDASGQFSFDHLPPGQFRVTASRPGFLSTSYGQRKPDRQGTPISLGAGEHASITIALIRDGVIAGMVVDDDGEPCARAQVMAYRYVNMQGVRRLQQTSGAQSDDRGEYRLSGLQPGDYLIGATPNGNDLMQTARADAEHDAIDAAIHAGGPTLAASPYAVVTITQPAGPVSIDGPASTAYLPTYFPSAASIAGATTVTIAGGEERDGVDIRTLAIRGTDLTGTITNLPAPPGRVQVMIRNDDPSVASASMPGAVAAPDGSFRLRNLPPGQYTIVAETLPVMNGPIVAQITSGLGIPNPGPLPETPRLWGRATATIDGQSTPPSITLTLQPGKSVSGQVIFDMATPPDLTRAHLSVMLSPTPDAASFPIGAPPQAMVGADGRFTIGDVFPGTYSLRTNGGGFLASAVVNGADTLDFPFVFDGDADVGGVVLTLTDRPSTITGTLTDASGKGVVDDTIVLAPADSRYWTPESRRIRIAQPDTNGQFQFSALPAGEYWMAAVTDLAPGSQYDPDALKAIATQSVPVTLGEGAKVQQNIRLAQ